jgi:DNA-binding response OmpR family regulator
MSIGRVLILDDSREHAKFISDVLGKKNWGSVLNFDVKTALRTLEYEKFDLLIMEMSVNGVNLTDMIDSLRTAGEGTPIALMSFNFSGGTYAGKVMASALEAGADFTLPKPATGEALTDLLKKAVEFNHSRSKYCRVLVVEDDVMLREAMVDVLTQVGCTVSWADNMEDAFFDHSVGMMDVVVAAVLTPGIGGVEGTAHIKAEWPHVKVIAISQDVNPRITAIHVLAAAQAAGAEAILAKPFYMRDLLKSLKMLVGAHQALPENAVQSAIDAFFD